MVFPVKTFAWERVALDIKMVQQREEACPLKANRQESCRNYICMDVCMSTHKLNLCIRTYIYICIDIHNVNTLIRFR